MTADPPYVHGDGYLYDDDDDAKAQHDAQVAGDKAALAAAIAAEHVYKTVRELTDDCDRDDCVPLATSRTCKLCRTLLTQCRSVVANAYTAAEQYHQAYAYDDDRTKQWQRTVVRWTHLTADTLDLYYSCGKMLAEYKQHVDVYAKAATLAYLTIDAQWQRAAGAVLALGDDVTATT